MKREKMAMQKGGGTGSVPIEPEVPAPPPPTTASGRYDEYFM